MIAQTFPHINTNLLAELTGRAHARYPQSAAPIRTAQAMVLNGAVTLVEPGVAFVESATHTGQYYRVQGSVCTCNARTTHCWHRFAVALVRHLQAEEAQPCPETTPSPRRYYAWLQRAHDDQEPLMVEAERTADGRYTVYHQGIPLATTIDAHLLTLLGEVALSDQKRLEDGNLVKKVCGR